ncbi:MAG: sugar transferase [Nitrospirota bacterium]|nr:sugar transferase [Nitrospirota bacterium]
MPVRGGIFQLAIKNVCDRVLSALMLSLLAPMLLGITLAVIFQSGWPAIFVQPRVGRGGCAFNVYKFRTMVQGASDKGLMTTVAEHDDRITQIGKFLRKWSLDELPQLVNVLKGDMSLVGPRPTLEYQVSQYTSLQRRRLEVKPGITGWAQVNGRNALPWARRIELDIWYVDNFTLWLDAKIMFRTIGVFLRREGLYGQGGVNDDFGTKRNV